MGCRKNLKRLTPAERTAFVNAFLELRSSGVTAQYAQQHSGAGSHGHGGPAFVAWHREYVRRFELDLQSVDPSVSLPYWDWTEANANPAGTESYIWRDDFLGGSGDNSGGGPPTGPFGGYPITSGPFAGLFTRRVFDIFSFPGTGGTISNRMANSDFNIFRQIESPHGSAHVFIGGHVMPFNQTPNTPDFWLIHSNVDRLWAEWINQHQGTPGFEPYKPVSGGPTGHSLNDTMWPWNGTNVPFAVSPWNISPEMVHPADVLDHNALGYQYDTIDASCQPITKNVIKDLRDGGSKSLIKDFRDGGKVPDFKRALKERLPKELKESGPKELKERSPKEFSPKEGKDIREDPFRPFIRPELRPDLRAAALGFESDAAELEILRQRLDQQ